MRCASNRTQIRYNAMYSSYLWSVPWYHTGNLDNSYMYVNACTKYYGAKKDKMIRTHGHDPHMLRARTVHI